VRKKKPDTGLKLAISMDPLRIVPVLVVLPVYRKHMGARDAQPIISGRVNWRVKRRGGAEHDGEKSSLVKSRRILRSWKRNEKHGGARLRSRRRRRQICKKP